MFVTCDVSLMHFAFLSTLRTVRERTSLHFPTLARILRQRKTKTKNEIKQHGIQIPSSQTMTDAALAMQNPMLDSTTLPSTRRLLTALINTLATSTEQNNKDQQQEQITVSNPLLAASETTKSTLLTLHTLFPTDLLPALDLLDRGLVTRFVIASSSDEIKPTLPQDGQKGIEHPPPPPTREQTLAYYVRSSRASHPRSRSAASASTSTAITTHCVHLEAWTCSCPAFAFAAFPAVDDSSDHYHANSSDGEDDEGWLASTSTMEWRFGGLTRGDARRIPPVCKHLLACVIAERCGSFAGLVEEREVGVEEAAGWAAGWGD